MTLFCAAALAGCAAPAPSAPSTTSTLTSPVTLAAVNGALAGETPAQTRIGPYDSALAGGEVVVSEGPAAGVTTTSDAQGAFELQLPAGPFRLRFSKAGFRTQTSASLIATPGSPISLGKIVLDTAPWVITGTVSDGRSLPVIDATVTIDVGGAFPEHLNVATDAAGRYRYASDRAHFPSLQISLAGMAIEPILSRTTACCNTDGDTVVNLTTLRVLRVIAVSPDTLRVGDAIELPPSRVQFDDGSERLLYLKPASSDPQRLAVSAGERGWVIRAVAGGEATLTMDDRGVTDRIRVVINQ